MIFSREKIARIYFPDRAAEFRLKNSYRQIKSERSDGFSAIRLHPESNSDTPVKLKIAFLSDLHYQGRAYHDRIIDSFCRFLEREKCDYLLLGGDSCGDACCLAPLPDVLRRLSGCAPKTFAVLGNWECGKCWITLQEWRELFASGGVALLNDSYIAEKGLFLGGLSDCRKSLKNPVIPEVDPSFDGFKLLISHNIDSALSAENYPALNSYDLVLCGHNHGGQIRLPLLGAPLSGSIYGRKFDYGLYRKKDESNPDIFISSGAGEGVVPFRLFCRREVVIVEVSNSNRS